MNMLGILVHCGSIQRINPTDQSSGSIQPRIQRIIPGASASMVASRLATKMLASMLATIKSWGITLCHTLFNDVISRLLRWVI